MATETATQAAAPITALIAGASGLVGKAVLERLLADSGCAQVHSLVRRRSERKHDKLREHVVDFGNLERDAAALPAVQEVYICLGTTIKIAGSQTAFRAVDFDAVVDVARIGISHGATKLGVVSAMGAGPESSVFYNRVKGEMEVAVAALGYASVSIVRPSLLAGDRQALGQAPRPAERLGLHLMRAASAFVPANYRAVNATDVADALLRQVREGRVGTHVLLSSKLHSV